MWRLGDMNQSGKLGGCGKLMLVRKETVRGRHAEWPWRHTLKDVAIHLAGYTTTRGTRTSQASMNRGSDTTIPSQPLRLQDKTKTHPEHESIVPTSERVLLDIFDSVKVWT